MTGFVLYLLVPFTESYVVINSDKYYYLIHLFLFPILSKWKKVDYGMLSVHSFIRSSVRPFIRPKFAISQKPLGIIRAPGILQMPKHHNHWADSLQINFIGTVLACRCATAWSFAHGGIMGMPMSMIRAPGILWMLELHKPMGLFTPNQFD